MRTMLRRYRAGFAAGWMIVTGAVFLAMIPAAATQPTTASGDYRVIVPTTCPTRLGGGFTGYLFGIPYAGHQWTATWNRVRVLSPAYDNARYQPETYTGYQSGKGNYIRAYYGRARWYQPLVDVKCTAIDHYFLGQWIGREESYDPYRYFGTVDDCDSASGVSGTEAEYDTPIYTPDDYTADDSGCGSSDPAGGDEPLSEDEWYEMVGGIRFRCQRTEDQTGLNIISCVPDE